MRLQYYADEDGESVIGLWIPKRRCFIDVSAQEEQIWHALLPEGKKIRKEIETWISQGASDGVAIDPEGLVLSSALHVQPGNIACLGLTYPGHADEFGEPERKLPALFLKSVSAISTDLSYVICPEGSKCLDYEVELAVIIGSPLRRATADEARRAILGYTLLCDYTERSYQLEHGGQWTKGKSYDSFAPFGPILVSKDELPDPDNLTIELKVNGELRQKASTSELMMPVAELIAHVSQYMTLNPGDVVSTGTPAGVSMNEGESRHLKVGDVVEFGCDRIGWVTQTVEAEEDFED